MPFKYCIKCKTLKSKNRFSPSKRTKDKLMTYCRDCQNEIHKQVRKRQRHAVLLIIGHGIIQCIYCGCNKEELIEINHKNGGGAKEWRKQGGGSALIKAIYQGIRSYKDLELVCRVCNARDYIERKFGKQKWEIRWINGCQGI
jgi:hypothetical protein